MSVLLSGQKKKISGAQKSDKISVLALSDHGPLGICSQFVRFFRKSLELMWHVLAWHV